MNGLFRRENRYLDGKESSLSIFGIFFEKTGHKFKVGCAEILGVELALKLLMSILGVPTKKLKPTAVQEHLHTRGHRIYAGLDCLERNLVGDGVGCPPINMGRQSVAARREILFNARHHHEAMLLDQYDYPFVQKRKIICHSQLLYQP